MASDELDNVNEQHPDTTKKSVNMTALAAKYRHDRVDEKTGGIRKKLDYHPVRYDYEEGYTFFHHKPLEGMKDEAFANRNYFMLLNDVAMSDMSANRIVDPLSLTTWLYIMAPNGKYLGTDTREIEGTGEKITKIYADTDKEHLSQRNVFRITRWNDPTGKNKIRYLIAQNELYMTVDPSHNMFDILMTELDAGDMDGYQTFIIERGNRPDVITFCTDIVHPWKYWRCEINADWFDVKDGFEPYRIHRYLSLYDQYVPHGTFCKAGSNPCERKPCRDPNNSNNRGYPDNYTGDKECMLKAIGNAYWQGYEGYYTKNPEEFLGQRDIGRISNNYVFRVNPDIFDIGEDSILVGYDGKVRWVKYHENIFDRRNNYNVIPKYVFDEVEPSLLIEHAYENAVVNSDEGEDPKNNPTLDIQDKKVTVDRQYKGDYDNAPIELKTVSMPTYEYSTLGKEIPEVNEDGSKKEDEENE